MVSVSSSSADVRNEENKLRKALVQLIFHIGEVIWLRVAPIRDISCMESILTRNMFDNEANLGLLITLIYLLCMAQVALLHPKFRARDWVYPGKRVVLDSHRR